MRFPTTLLIVSVLLPASALAQDETRLKTALEGRRLTLKIDMPASSTGVDIYPALERPLDYKRYGDRLRVYGVSIKTGETSTVTMIKVKKDLIEFHLGGGGFGNESGTVVADYVGKSNREKDLEKEVKAESDAARKRRLQSELDSLRRSREREERNNQATARAEEAANKERIARERLHGGSRFNLRYDKAVPAGMTADDVMAALREYVDTSTTSTSGVEAQKPAARTDGLPRKGMSRTDAVREFGAPIQSTTRNEGTLSVLTLVFVKGELRISAEFVEDVLISYTMKSQ